MTPISRKSILFAAAFLVAPVIAAAGLAPSAVFAQSAPDYAAIVAAPDRSDADRKTDERRDPLQAPGVHRCAPRHEGARYGRGRRLQLRAHGPRGGAGRDAHGQIPPDFPERGKARFDARLQTPAGKKIVGLTRAFDDPVPADVHDLDLITFLFFYHDTTYMNVDRAAMNRKLFAALKPGGILIIADHSARLGDGTTVGKTLHRIEEAALRHEVENAGFKLVGEGNFWRHPEDPRDFSIQPVSGKPVDEFALKFQKPN